MSDLVRFGVAMDRALLQEFDRRIAGKGYENRSEALRDLVRADLTRAAWDAGAKVAATVTIVFEVGAREVVGRLAELEAEAGGVVAAAMRVPLGGGRALEVMAVRGRPKELAALAGEIGGAKGVLSCELTLATIVADGATAGTPGGAE